MRGDEVVDSGQIPAPNVIKIDTEGAEAKVLEGLRKTLAESSVRAIVFEEQRGGQEPAPARALLEAAGFTVEAVDAERPEEHANCLAVRAG